MRNEALLRLLQVLLAIGLVSFYGCLGKSPSPRFYTLSAIPEGQATPKRQISTRTAIVGIGPIKVADYLDHAKLVTHTGDNRLVKAEFDLWAGNLKDNLTNVLRENIGLLLPTDRLYIHPWRLSRPVDYQIILDVVRFDGDLGENAWLVARWRIVEGKEGRLLAVSRSSIREPVGGPDYDALVAAQSRALAQLSHEIVAAIQAASRERRPDE